MGVTVKECAGILGKMMDAAIESGDPKMFPTTMLWGPPGIGKSSIIRQVAEERNIGFRDVRLSLVNPVDLRGLPIPNKEHTTANWIPPVFLPNEDDNPVGILFLDEYNAAREFVQVAALQLILDKAIGEYVMPPMWFIVAAGNRVTDHVYVQKMSSAHGNRMVHLDIEADLPTWRNWAYEHDVHPLVMGFVQLFPHFFMQEPGNATGGTAITADYKGFCTPRSWAVASRMYSVFRGAEDRILYEILGGTVGPEAAGQFVAFSKIEEALPDFGQILDGTARGEIAKDDPAISWSCISGMVGTLLRRNPLDARSMSNFMGWLTTWLASEFQTSAMVELVHSGRWNELVMFAPVSEWYEENGKYLKANI